MKRDNRSETLESFQILGVRGTILTVPELHKYIGLQIDQNEKKLILHVNVHGLNLAHQYPWLRDFYNQADLVFCDGAGVILGARILGYHIPERITYANWMWQLAEYAESRMDSLFFLGGRPGTVEKAIARLQHKHPDLKIVGSHHGYFSKNRDSAENRFVLEKINAVKPNILIVGFGMPLQEHWILENWFQIQANVTFTGGAVFDYISGNLRRAPQWMTNNGLEWLGRLIIEPRRLWKRYIVGNPYFLWRVLLQRVGILRY